MITGAPPAFPVTVKVVFDPSQTAVAKGWFVMLAALITVSMATEETADGAQVPLTTTWYWLLFIAAVTAVAVLM